MNDYNFDYYTWNKNIKCAEYISDKKRAEHISKIIVQAAIKSAIKSAMKAAIKNDTDKHKVLIFIFKKNKIKYLYML